MKGTLRKYPQTLLGAMFSEGNQNLLLKDEVGEYFIDRNGKAFAVILDFYRNGVILLSSDISMAVLKSEMDYFQIPSDALEHEAKHREEYVILRITQEFFATTGQGGKFYQCLYQTTDNNLSKLIGKIQGDAKTEGIEVLKQQLVHQAINQLSEKGFSLVCVADAGDTVYLKRLRLSTFASDDPD
eukprot:TRINITY_DN10683_c0_g1_i1.p1 TRINITY_DN10683_c0_g1~~TRINITY_DN10683_c0_g1_i1.p1  ORF type:complete len:216 (+),score=38.48 TRINITY_DN10683_c0_g1_i1:94-648(+)